MVRPSSPYVWMAIVSGCTLDAMVRTDCQFLVVVLYVDHWVDQSAFPRRDITPYVGMPFIHCTEGNPCANRQVLIKVNSLELADAAAVTQSLKYV